MDITKILSKNEFSFSKKFGQNFITDTNLLKVIAAGSGITKDDIVVEVGVGAGTLTRELSLCAKKVIGFEIDGRLDGVLKETLSGLNNIELIYKDILKVGNDELRKLCGGPFKVVANLPYYITTPVIFYFLNNSDCLSLTIMVQKEVAERLTAKADTSAYGAVTAQVNALGETKYLRTVNRNMFIPPPNVDSAVVRIDVCPKCGVDDFKLLQRVIAAAFEMRRKTLVNNLSKAFAIKKETAAEVLSQCQIKPDARGETLDIDMFIKLSNNLKLLL